MAIARCQQIDASVTRWYHCMTRCVRRAFLLQEGTSDRKEWLENRIEELAEIFAVGVGGFSVMCKKQPDAWACDGSQTWRDARPVDATLIRESHRAHGRPCPLFPRASDPIVLPIHCRFRSRPHPAQGVRRSPLVELDAGDSLLLRWRVETGRIGSGHDEPEHECTAFRWP